MSEGIKTVGVLGLGVMGFDIAFLYAQKDCRTSVQMVYAVMARRGVAEHGQSFYKEGQPNPWVAAFVDRRSYARH